MVEFQPLHNSCVAPRGALTEISLKPIFPEASKSTSEIIRIWCLDCHGDSHDHGHGHGEDDDLCLLKGAVVIARV